MSNRRKLRRADEDLGRCRWPGCRLRWTTQIIRDDDQSAFVCDEHTEQLLEELPPNAIRSIRSMALEFG